MSDITRTLLESDAWCPSCGHNRNTSSVSSIECLDGSKQCQMCCARWREVPNERAATSNTPDLAEMMRAARQNADNVLNLSYGKPVGDFPTMLTWHREYKKQLRAMMGWEPMP